MVPGNPHCTNATGWVAGGKEGNNEPQHARLKGGKDGLWSVMNAYTSITPKVQLPTSIPRNRLTGQGTDQLGYLRGIGRA